MNILIACEYSGIVRDAFTRKGHNAISCDLIPTESPGNHYQGDVFDIINDGWDMMIAHPPCTYLSNAARRVWNAPGRAEKRQEALEFFLKLYNAPILKIAVENTIGYVGIAFRKPDQIIQPYYFGDPVQKKTCLWLKGLPPLIGFMGHSNPQNTKLPGNWFNKGGKDRQKNRAKTFPGIARAMADQWG